MNFTEEPLTTSIGIVILPDNTSSDERYYLSNNFNVSMLVLNLVLSLIAISLNITVMTFYRSRLKDIIPFIYFTLSTSDLLTGISGALHSVIFFGLLVLGPTSGSPVLFYMALLAYCITVVSFRVSAFVSLIFSTIRTINIVSPFTWINHLAVIVVIIVHGIFWAAVVMAETIVVVVNNDGTHNFTDSQRLSDFFLGFFYSPSNPKLARYISDTHYGTSAGQEVECVLSLLYTGISITFLALLAFVGMVIQVVYLLKPEVKTNKASQKGDIAVTIILITLLFVVCSTCALFQPIFKDCSGGVQDVTSQVQVGYMLTYFFGYLPFFLNAALNPVILVLRVKGLRSHVMTMHRARTISTEIAVQSRKAPGEKTTSKKVAMAKVNIAM